MVNPTANLIRDAYLILETGEKVLNLVGYFPFVGSLSGTARLWYAKIEMITGIALSIFALTAHLAGIPSGTIYCVFGATLFGHGILNQIRSYFEFIPGLAIVTTLPYDILSMHSLGRRLFSYPLAT